MTKKKGQGRPSEYEPIFDSMLIEHMSKGYSYESFAAKEGVNVCRKTLYNWESSVPSWAKAKEIAWDKCLLFWETQGIDGLYNESFKDADGSTHSKSINATLWIFNMKNRFKWRDKQPDEEDNSVPKSTLLTSELLAIVRGEK